MDRVADLHLDVVALAGHPHVGLPQFAKEIQGMSSLLTKGQAQGVLLAALFEGFLHVTSDAVEAIGGAGAVDPLVRTLMVVVGDPVGKTLTGVGEGGKDGVFKELSPDSAPETLDLAQCHRMVGGAAHVLHTLATEHLLELRLAPPGYELSAIVGEDLPRRSPLADASPHYFQDRLGCLLPEETVTHDVPGVVVDDSHQVDPEHPLELEGEDIDLPQGVRYLSLEAPYLGLSGFGGRGRVAKISVVDHPTDRFGTHLEPLVAPQLVTDAPHSHLGIGAAKLLDPLLQRFTGLPRTWVGGLPDQGVRTVLPVKLIPLVDGMLARPHQLRHLGTVQTRLFRPGRQQLHFNWIPLPA